MELRISPLLIDITLVCLIDIPRTYFSFYFKAIILFCNCMKTYFTILISMGNLCSNFIPLQRIQQWIILCMYLHISSWKFLIVVYLTMKYLAICMCNFNFISHCGLYLNVPLNSHLPIGGVFKRWMDLGHVNMD